MVADEIVSLVNEPPRGVGGSSEVGEQWSGQVRLREPGYE